MNTTDYTKFDFEDFAQDVYFRKWVIDRDVQAEKFWTNWLIENPMFVDKVQLAKAFLYALEEKDTSLDKASLEMITDEVAGQSNQLKPFWQRTFWRVAASILFFLALGWWYQVTSNFTVPKKQLETAPVFSNSNIDFIEKRNLDTIIQKIILDDGTMVTLYPFSILRYPKEFEST
jgi:transmembrane sensor